MQRQTFQFSNRPSLQQFTKQSSPNKQLTTNVSKYNINLYEEQMSQRHTTQNYYNFASANNTSLKHSDVFQEQRNKKKATLQNHLTHNSIIKMEQQWQSIKQLHSNFNRSNSQSPAKNFQFNSINSARQKQDEKPTINNNKIVPHSKINLQLQQSVPTNNYSQNNNNYQDNFNSQTSTKNRRSKQSSLHQCQNQKGVETPSSNKFLMPCNKQPKQNNTMEQEKQINMKTSEKSKGAKPAKKPIVQNAMQNKKGHRF